LIFLRATVCGCCWCGRLEVDGRGWLNCYTVKQFEGFHAQQEMKYLVTAFYKFASLPDYQERKEPLYQFCKERGLKGTILLAAEGINSTISGEEKGLRELLDDLQSDPAIGDLVIKESWSDDQPFYRLKVRLKKEIVTLGMPGIDPNVRVGEYVAPEDWDTLIADPEVTLIDTRNDYEVAIGTFENAINPQMTTFRGFPDYVSRTLDPQKHKKIAMFCTGGIRCEKASSYMLEQGFESVYHLEGGILNYIEKISSEKSKWQGECFVFDKRVSVNENLEEGDYAQCYACRRPLSENDMQSEQYEKGVSCPHCFGARDEKDLSAFRDRQMQVELAASRNERHIGS